ncbi:MAG TPA: peptidoglycan recognition family protein [Solirubrobacteraceae bacterium]|nr:peptidoglycan recognition family protein [Solirubrobacteraceae bacterium]
MPARALTRRTFLLGALGAGASGLAQRTSALAALAPPARARVDERTLGALAAGITRVELARNVDLFGLQWRAPHSARLEVSFRDARGRWSAWVPAGPSGHAPDGAHRVSSNGSGAALGGLIAGEPVWSGGTRAIAVRSDRALAGARLQLVDVSDGLGARRLALASPAPALADLRSVAALPLAEPTLAAGAGQPPIIARRAWARGRARPRVTPAYGSVQLAFVHHTENPNGYAPGEVPAMLRAIFAFHKYVNGWNDIGYNFAIDAFGRIFEARAGGIDEPVIGAHAGGYNYASTGIAVLGSFQSAPISRAAHASLARLLAWKLSLHGVAARGHATVKVNPAGSVWSKYPANARVPLPSIAGHRDADSTDCPGDALYAQLPDLRGAVRALAPRPTRATLALLPPAPVPPAGQPGASPSPSPPGAPGEASRAAGALTVTGALELLDGTPLAGATVAIQARSVSHRGQAVREQTLVSAQSDADGAFSATLPPQPAGSRALALRALYLGGEAPGGAHSGAAISAPLLIPASALHASSPVASSPVASPRASSPLAGSPPSAP